MNGTFSKFWVSRLSSSPPIARLCPCGHFDLSVHPANVQRWNRESRNLHAIGKVQRTDFRGDLETDRIARSDRWNEVQAHAKFLELNRDRACAASGDSLDDRVGIFSAGEKTGLLAIRSQ